MEERSGWLQRSLDQARANIEARPEHLKPARYRTDDPATRKRRSPARTKRRTTSDE